MVAQACLSSLLQTAVKTSFPFLSLATRQSYNTLQAALTFFVEKQKLHIKNLRRICLPLCV